jgi:CTP:molybdopterin cytidylyltransferase MocA
VRAAAVILAAGRGERLGGVAKAALRVPDGRTFLQAVTDAARAGGCARLVLVVAEPHAAAARAAGVVDAVVENPAPERGMASSFACAIPFVADCDVALLWPVDHPFVAARTVAAVLAAATRDAIVVPVHGGRGGHPTAFGAAWFARCAAAADAPDGLRSVLAAGGAAVTRLLVDDASVLRDVDEPADL